MAQLGITSISLDYISGNYEINGNPIEQQSTFVINGNTQTIADAWFSYDPLNTIYDGSAFAERRAAADERENPQLELMNIPLIKMLEQEGIQLVKEQEKAADHKMEKTMFKGSNLIVAV